MEGSERGQGLERIRILIAEADLASRNHVAGTLRNRGDQFEIVGEVSNGQEALAFAGAASPDVVLADVHLPGMNGLELTRSVRQQQPTISVILLAAEQKEGELFDAIRFGAAAYVTKDVAGPELADTVTRVHNGTYVIDDSVLANPALASRVLNAFRELAAEEDQQVKPFFVPLSAREIEVLENAARGNSNKQIARLMGISEQTVKNHLTSIMRKLAVNDRTQAVVFALRQGWIRVTDL